MKIIECDQYSDEWWKARRGLPTASGFSKLITPTGKPSTQAHQYACELVAETIVAEDENAFTESEWMIRGRELEEEARDWYSMKIGAEIQQVGFCINDAGTFGASPDGIISPPGPTAFKGLEVKCPKGSTHVSYLAAGTLPKAYWPQVHGQLLVTGYSSWVFISYHPSFRPLVVTVKPDSYTAKLSVAVNKFVKDLESLRAKVLS